MQVSQASSSQLPILLQERIASLQEAILSKHPSLPTLLQEIHRTLKAQPENVTLASEEEIGIIVSGLQVQTQTSLVKEVIAKSGKAGSGKSVAAKLLALGDDAI